MILSRAAIVTAALPKYATAAANLTKSMNGEDGMIVQTRYRDIPWEEAGKCHHDTARFRDEWERRRGQPIRIKTPAVPIVERPLCAGPFYVLVGYIWKDRPVVVCPHIAEIGD
jgi:lysozyme family protein